VLFKNKEFAGVDWISESGSAIDDTYKFKIVPEISMISNKEDAVRLYEAPQEEDEKNFDSQKIVSFAGVVEEALLN
jgi:hypothetical protein